MIIGIPKETAPGEKRVAIIPANVQALVKKGHTIKIEASAGLLSGYNDAEYEKAGAEIVDRAEAFKQEIVIQVQTPGVNTKSGADDMALLTSGQWLIGHMDPLGNPQFAKEMAEKGINGVALELIPRITRAQSMDVLSSMAMIAGYKAVLLGAHMSPRMFPMSMTAAGTISPARVFVMGAGVAGLQACATAKRLGGIVEAYDIRPDAQEQIISVGAKPIELDLKAETGEGGYAKEQSAEFIAKQQELMGEIMAQQDVIITTAAIPGRKSPILITKDQVKGMKPGTVIIDLASERGGNCELTKHGKVVVKYDVTIFGPDNVPSTAPFHASQMYGKNIENLLNLIAHADNEFAFAPDFDDEIIANTVTAYNNDVPHARLRDMLDMPALATETASPEA
ncbi:MAG: Re/Si-specific NAD(P)(+) transhydrogenase subunit alpha [Pseudomonadota bacterium]